MFSFPMIHILLIPYSSLTQERKRENAIMGPQPWEAPRRGNRGNALVGRGLVEAAEDGQEQTRLAPNPCSWLLTHLQGQTDPRLWAPLGPWDGDCTAAEQSLPQVALAGGEKWEGDPVSEVAHGDFWQHRPAWGDCVKLRSSSV